jgi:hypothetical protein
MTAAGILAANVAAMLIGRNEATNGESGSSSDKNNIELNNFVYIEGSQEDTQIQSKLVAAKNLKKSNKQIKCYCNDESVCPEQDSDVATGAGKKAPAVAQDNANKPYEIDNDFLLDMNSHQREKALNGNKNEPMRLLNIEKLLNATSGNIRQCMTNTVCFTKRLLRGNGDYWYKYTCDQSPADSIRGQVIEFRDCKINTSNEIDRSHVKDKSSEFCCNEQDYCNVNLHPIVASRDLEDLPHSIGDKKPKGGNKKPSPVNKDSSLISSGSSSSNNNINYPNDRIPIRTNNNNNNNNNNHNNIGSIAGSGGASGLFLLNPVNISLSVVLFLFFFIIVFLLACFLFNKSRNLKKKLKNTKSVSKNLLEKKKIVVEKEDTEPKEEQNFSSSSSTKSSLSACSHLTGKIRFVNT